MAGVRNDQVALYLMDMYKAEREGYEEMPTVYDKVFKVVTGIKGAGDKNTQILGAGDVTRHLTEGQQVNFKSPIQGWEYLVNYWTFSDGLSLTKEAVEDTTKLGDLLKDLAATWGESIRVEKETTAATVFNRGGDLLGEWVFNGTHTGNTDSSGDMLYDGYPLFNLTGNARSSKGGATYYNSIASLTVTPGNFETLYNLHTATNNRNERDRVIKNPCDTFLCRPGADTFAAERIFDTTKGIPGGQLNDNNVYYKLCKVISWDYLLSSESAFYIGKSQSNKFQFRERQQVELRFFRDETNLGYKVSCNLRFGVFIKDWRVWSRGGGTSA
jgi:hypothetical protein